MTMKQNHNLLSIITLLLIVFCNTAFIIVPKSDRNSAAILIIENAPPQYQQEKTRFFERFMLKKIEKNVNKSGKQIDLDKTSEKALRLGSLSIKFLVAMGILAVISIIFVFTVATINLVVILLSGVCVFIYLAIINAVRAIANAESVLDNVNATDDQKKLSKKGKSLGCLTLAILGILLFIFILGVSIVRKLQ